MLHPTPTNTTTTPVINSDMARASKGGKKRSGTASTVRQLAAKRRLECARVDLARAAEQLEEFDREARGSPSAGGLR